MLALNSVAPTELPDEHGNNVHLLDLRGSGCCCGGTRKRQRLAERSRDRACDSARRFQELDAVRAHSHRREPAFSEAQNFPFRLLSDVDRAVGSCSSRPPDDQYAEYLMRHSYLIDPEGRIHRRYDVTDVTGHAADVIADSRRHSKT
jgi:hypothetical protein